MSLVDRLTDVGTRGDEPTTGCRCTVSFDEPTGMGLTDRVECVVDSDDCPGAGDLATEPTCRATVVDALASRDGDADERSNGWKSGPGCVARKSVTPDAQRECRAA